MMLALKTMNVPLATAAQAARSQLPSEVLDRVAEYLYEGSCFQVDTLTAFSLVSKHFRKSALPLLFGTISHVVRDELHQQEHGFRRLLDNQHLLGYIHTLHVLRPAETPDFVYPSDQHAVETLSRTHRALDLQVIRSSLPYMSRLRCIRLDCSAAAAQEIVDMLSSDKQYELIFDHLYTSSNWPDLMAATTDIALSAQCHQYGVGVFGGHPISHPVLGKGAYDVMSKAIAINLHVAWLYDASNQPVDDGYLWDIPDAQSESDETSSSLDGYEIETFAHGRARTVWPLISTTPGFRKKVSWTELHLVVEHQERDPTHILNDPGALVIPWHKLRRLELVWRFSSSRMYMSVFVNYVACGLPSLQALRLQAYNQCIFHPGCPYEPEFWAPPPDFCLIEINYTELENLEELEIDGICNHIPIQNLMGPNLRVLRLHHEDFLFSVYSAESQRSHNDILTAARLSPKLEHLELDIGYIDKLWHSVAIPGIDVDLEQYAFLNALAKFRHLRFLRLFPPFVDRDAPRNSRSVSHRPPVADYQAVKIFQHLHNICPSLQLLSIAAIPSIMNVDTMYWNVKSDGNTTVLTTGHRARNYQHRQIWVGERRIRSEIRRFRMPPPYLPDSHGWLLTRDDRLRIVRSP